MILLVGGPGGHTAAAYAVAYYLSKMGVPFDVLVPKKFVKRFEGLGCKVIAAEPPMDVEEERPNLRRTVNYLLKILLLRRYEKVFVTGSNYALLPAIKERLLGAKVYSLESIDRFVRPSKTTYLLYKYKITSVQVLHWEEQKSIYPKGKVYGPIVEPPLAEPEEGDYILVTTGTVGYKELFDEAAKAFGKDAIIQTGNVDPKIYEGTVREAFSYSLDFPKLLAKAKAVVTAFPGSVSAVARLSYKKPVVMVFNPHRRKVPGKEDMYVYAKKLNAVALERPEAEKLREALKEALKMPLPEYPNGALRLARELAG